MYRGQLNNQCRSGSGLYSGGLTWSIVLTCGDHTGIFTCDGCARDPYFYVPAETQIELCDYTTISSQPRYPLRQQDTLSYLIRK